MLHPYFRLFGDFDPDEITRLMEIRPSWENRIGDPGPSDAVRPRQGAEWAWQPEDGDSDHVGDQLAFLAGSLSSKREQVAKLSKKFWGTFHVYNVVDRIDRTWFTSPQVLRLIADLHVCIECENIYLAQIKETVNDAN
jgi:hypothetical protein